MSKSSTEKGERALSAFKHQEANSSSGDDWRDTKTAEQCLDHLCLSEHLSDVLFTFDSDQSVKLPAHKFILSMRSAVFEAMFNGPLAEQGDTVLIKDVEPESMEVLFRYVYTDKLDVNDDNILSCLYAAKKYSLTGLVQQCSRFLESNIEKDNVCSIHEQAVFYDMESLQEKCFDYILENATNVFATRGFMNISHETLYKLFEDDALSAEEIDIFNAAVRWAQYKCKTQQMPKTAENERKLLDKVLFEIRFPTMPIAEFARAVTPTGVLTNKEQVMLYQFLATQGSSPLTKFNREIRSGGMVTLDITKHINAYHQCDLQGYNRKGNQQGLCLQFSNSKYEENEYSFVDYEFKKSSVNRRSPTVKSVKGTFVKNVKSITVGNTQVVNFKTVGDRIVFQTHIRIDHGITIQFHSTDIVQMYYDYQISNPGCASYRVRIQKNINGQMVNIVSVPVGIESITFAKH